MITIISFSILGACIIIAAGIISRTLLDVDTTNKKSRATMACLVDFVKAINENFVGSNLVIVDNGNEVKVQGQIKYYKPEQE